MPRREVIVAFLLDAFALDGAAFAPVRLLVISEVGALSWPSGPVTVLLATVVLVHVRGLLGP